MAKQRIKIQLADNIKRVAFIESGATQGATIGTDLYYADGTVVTLVNLAAALGVTDAATAVAHKLLVGLTLGDDHPQYTRKDTLTTKGDIYVAASAGVPARLPVGTTGTVLTAANGTPTWLPPAPSPMFLAEDGAEGERGPPGADGRAGAAGPAGPAVFLEADAGEDGMTGAPGAAGAPGSTGAQGPAGPAIWLEAEQGEQGDPGQPGGAGPPGSTGPAGVPGPATYLEADAGEDAIFGPQGNPGATGLTGAQGPMGVAPFLEDGAPGDDGAPGASGPPGATGLTGAQGPAGAAIFLEGDAGDTGDTGPPGPQGPLGPTGAQGPLGAAVFLDADAGDEGAPGAPGSPGATGLTGAQGPLGPVVYFLAEDGPEGDRGVQGPPGNTGAQGPAGVALYVEADAGDEGAPGAPGSPGATGLTGAAGPSGPAIAFLDDANIFDDPGLYPPGPTNLVESGTWTPVFVGTTVAGAATYGTQVGYYVRIGNMVFVTAVIGLATLGGATGNANINGLPFTCSAKASENWMQAVRWTGITFAANYTTICTVVAGGTTVLQLEKSGGAGVAAVFLTIGEIAANAAFVLTGCYRMA